MVREDAASRALAATWSVLPADEARARAALTQTLSAAEQQGSALPRALAAAGLLLAMAIEYADFRGLTRATAVFLDADPGPDAALVPLQALLLDLARITLPSLDGAHPFSAATDFAAERVHGRLYGGSGLDTDLGADFGADARMLALKMLMDYHGMRLDLPRIERLIALGHDMATQPGVSPAWQGRWWLLVVQNREWFGDQAATAQALLRAQQLTKQHALPRLRFELACVEMSAALKANDLPGEDRLFRELEALRPAVRPGRLPHGLRAQALYLAYRGELVGALERIDLLLALCTDMEVPRRDRGAYEVLRADCLLGLGRQAQALAVLYAQRPDQQGPQGELLEARIQVHLASGALDRQDDQADDLCRNALQACARLRYSRFLRPLPQSATRLVERGLDLGVERDFLTAVIHERRLRPADPTREDWPWRLRVQALGPLQIRRDGLLVGSPSAKAQRKPLELLCLLAAYGGGPLAVSVVIDQLWPSLDADAPHASFEMAVSRLRKLLGLPGAVRVIDDAVGLDPALVWLDVSAFETLARQVGAADRALALYQAPLLGAQTLTGLMHTARERLGLAYAALAQAEAERLLAHGQLGHALHVLHGALLHDPLSTALHRALARAAGA